MLKNIKNIIFDFDGVIADTEYFQYEIWIKLLKEKNLPIDNLSLSSIAGISDLIAITRSCHGLKKEDYQNLVKEKKKRCNDEIDKIEPVPEIDITFKKYSKSKIFYICSNSSHNVINFFMTKYFPNVRIEYSVCKGVFQKGKPDPDPYLLLLKHTKIDMDQTIAIEDSLAGIESAKKSGLNVIYLNRYHISIPIITQIQSLCELNKFIDY